MEKEELERLIEASASGELSQEQMQATIDKFAQIIQFIRQQVRYGRAGSNWQRAALDNIQNVVG